MAFPFIDALQAHLPAIEAEAIKVGDALGKAVPAGLHDAADLLTVISTDLNAIEKSLNDLNNLMPAPGNMLSKLWDHTVGAAESANRSAADALTFGPKVGPAIAKEGLNDIKFHPTEWGGKGVFLPAPPVLKPWSKDDYDPDFAGQPGNGTPPPGVPPQRGFLRTLYDDTLGPAVHAAGWAESKAADVLTFGHSGPISQNTDINNILRGILSNSGQPASGSGQGNTASSASASAAGSSTINANVTVPFDARAASSQIAAAILPKLQAAFLQQQHNLAGAAQQALVESSMGGIA